MRSGVNRCRRRFGKDTRQTRQSRDAGDNFGVGDGEKRGRLLADVDQRLPQAVFAVKPAARAAEGGAGARVPRGYERNLVLNPVRWVVLNPVLAAGHPRGHPSTPGSPEAVAAVGLLWERVPPTVRNMSGRQAYIMSMYVVPSMRRRGVAKQLITTAVDHAREPASKPAASVIRDRPRDSINP